jgi:hypothetical protein
LNLTLASNTASLTAALATSSSNANAGLATVTAQISSLTYAAPTVATASTVGWDLYPLLIGSGTWVPLSNFVYTNSLSETVYLSVTMRGVWTGAVASAATDDVTVSAWLAMKDNVSGVSYDGTTPSFSANSTLLNVTVPFSLSGIISVAPGETKTVNLSYALAGGTSGSVSLLQDSRWLSWFRIK